MLGDSPENFHRMHDKRIRVDMWKCQDHRELNPACVIVM